MRSRVARVLAAVVFSAVAMFPRAALCVGDAGHVAIELGDDSCCPADRAGSMPAIVDADDGACPTHCRDTLMGVGATLRPSDDGACASVPAAAVTASVPLVPFALAGDRPEPRQHGRPSAAQRGLSTTVVLR